MNANMERLLRSIAERDVKLSDNPHVALAQDREDARTVMKLLGIRPRRTVTHCRADSLLGEALDGLNNWTQGHAEESSKTVCGCCGKQFCLMSCECANLINRIKRHLNEMDEQNP